MLDSAPTLERVRGFLREKGIEFREVHHEPTRTSEESAEARGEELRVGGKALLVKVDDIFAVFVLSAARKFDSGAVRRLLGARRSRFATPDELLDMTGLVPGSLPPFGTPLFSFKLYIDESIAENERIAFNAGSLTDSIIMSTQDYLRAAGGTLARFSKSENDSGGTP
ncbi:MAG: hypothetical protein M5R36_14265 [Deltaproteobacteria bacterium]|nr:hypothetical protein [Deltaproteobacteria bacterium]